MKSILVAATLLLSFSAFSFQDGTYTCGNRADFFEAVYKVTTLTVEGTQLPHFEITKNYFKSPTNPDSKDHSFKISGIATVFTNNEGVETLVLGNIMVDLTAGRITCK